MASLARGNTDDVRRTALSPRPKGRESAKDTLCRNVTIYGHCRYENKGCAFNHDPFKSHSPTENMKKRFNVDSPSFTPSQGNATLAVNGTGVKALGLSPKAASAAPFKPKGYNGVGNEAAGFAARKQYNPTAPDWSIAPAADVVDYISQPQMLQPQIPQNIGDANGGLQQALYDSFTPTAPMGNPSHGHHQTQMNPYTQDPANNSGTSYFQNSTFSQPLNYHLYASFALHRENLLPHQRLARDFFMSDTLREDIQRRQAATLQTLPNSSLPLHIDHFHSLVPLDTTNQKNATLFGYPSWIYKAVSGKDGHTYALRRLEGYRLTNEKAIRSVQNWKRVVNSNVVTVSNAFTTTNFGDSSLMIVTDYYPLSKTLSEVHFATRGFATRSHNPPIAEPILWSYMVQIANALKAIHNAGLAARLIDASKIIITKPNIVRLNACAILDVVQYEVPKTLEELQIDDLLQFGRLMLSLGTGTPKVAHSIPNALEHFSRIYSASLKERVMWLLGMTPSITNSSDYTIELFITSIATHVMSAFDASQSRGDDIDSEFSKEVENGRLVRLMTKIHFITERPEYSQDSAWSETGERFHIKLFRDYVFHQISATGDPVLDLGHVITCLNKLDAGTDEKVTLMSRDEQIVIIVTYKEVKRAIEGAYGDLQKAARRGGGM